MIDTKNKMREILDVEFTLYSQAYGFSPLPRVLYLRIIRDRRWRIWKFQKFLRKSEYYKFTKEGVKLLNVICYIYYTSRRNILAEKIGFDIQGYGIGKGLQIYHSNIVVNGRAKIGRNMHFHGENVIGNDGINIEACPTIGNNVMLGAGAKVFGNVTIADNIKIGAGSIVISSFTESGITIGGIPARKLK